MKSSMLACLPVLLLVPSAALAQEKVDLRIVSRIRHEAFENSKVMEHMFYLTDANGPRLSNSPGFKRAGEWAVKTLKGYGLDNAHPEKFEFGQGWENTRFAVNVVEPNYQPLIGVPGAWTAGTDGPMTAEVVMATIKAEEDFEKWKGKLAGKIVLLNPEREISPLDKPLNHRYTDAELDSLALAPNPGERTGASANRAGRPPMNIQQLRAFRKKLAAFFVEEKVAAVVYAGFNGDGGTVFTMMAGSRDVKDPVPPPMITLTPEHYNRIVRLMDKKIPVKLEIEAKNTFFKDDVNSFNVIGDIPGKTDEIVMMGGHLDSWHGAQGATDNAAGVAVMMEVARILNSLGVKMKRTVRIGLWGGEEQGLLGSKAYVKEHFADPATMKTTTEHAKLSAYYNLDNGSGKIRGVYLQGNDMMRPIFEAWLDPFKDLGARTVSIRNTGGTDHLSYDAVGLPGFQFIQDELEYSTRTHHSNMDNYDRIQKGDLMEAAAIIASFVYNTAMADEMMPRKPLPKARPAEGAGAPTGGSF